MNNVIEQMKSSKSFWYSDFFAKCKLVGNNAGLIKAVQRKGKYESFCFGDPNPKSKKKVFETLKRVFPFINEDKFDEATNGDGHEWKRIARLHSSSLLPFLLFSQISDKRPLFIRFQNPDLSYTDMRFAVAHFEIKNWLVKNDSHPSNVDVVLENDKAILFLESKFSEYFTKLRRNIKISEKRYGKQTYELISKGNVVIRIDGGRIISCDKNSHYLEGIKQVMAHCMGLEFSVKEGRYNHGGTPRHEGIPIGNRDVYLGEVLFDFGSVGKNTNELLEDYEYLYSKVVSLLNDRSDSPKVLPKPFTYQKLFKDFDLEGAVRDFYQLK